MGDSPSFERFIAMVSCTRAWPLACLLTLGCAAEPSDYVVIVPVKYVPRPATPAPNSRFGWLETTPAQAERFSVRVGEQKYFRIIEPYKSEKEFSAERAISLLSAFAEREVVARKFCTVAAVPSDERRLVGPQRPREMWISVECIK